MKRIILLFLLALLLFLLSCATSNQPTIPQAAINKIYAECGDEYWSKIYTIKHIEDKGDYCFISIDIQPETGEDLEATYERAKLCTDFIAGITVITLAEYGINKNVFVWAQLPLNDDEVVPLVTTFYSAKSHSLTHIPDSFIYHYSIIE